MRLSDSRRQLLQTIAASAGTAVLGNLPLAGRAGTALTARELRRGLGLGS